MLGWEIQWVLNNPKYYDGPTHQDAVIANMKKRYWIAEARRLGKAFTEFHSTNNRLALEEHLASTPH